MSFTTYATAVAGTVLTAAFWNQQIRDNGNIIKTSIDNGGNISFPAASLLTLASDACTPTQNYHVIDTEGGAAADDLSTLTVAGNIRQGHVLVLTGANSARVVTVKHNVGNIYLRSGDFKLIHPISGAGRWLILLYYVATWVELARSDYDLAAISQPQLANYCESQTFPSISGGTLTLNLALGNEFNVALNANITTLTIQNVPTAVNNVTTFTLTFTADGTLRTITWPGSFRWPGGTAPTMTSTNGKLDVIHARTYDNGTTWFAIVVSQNS